MPAPKGNKFAAGNKGGSRPSLYKPEFAKAAAKMCELGATDGEIAEAFNVSIRTIHAWKHEHEEFSASLKAGKTQADDRVERSLYQKATGYEVTEEQAVKLRNKTDGGVIETVEVVKVSKHVAADTTAAIFWPFARASRSAATRARTSSGSR